MGKKKSSSKPAPEPAPAAAPVENPNLAVLKRRDASLIDIIATSGHVVVYRYADSGWTKHNVEGPLFIVSRARAPFYRMVVLNRVTMHNLVEDLTPDFQMERNGPYLMYANNKAETLGFWFPEESKLEEMQQQMSQCIARLKAGKQPKPKPKTPPKKPVTVTAVLPRPSPAANQQASPVGAQAESNNPQRVVNTGRNGSQERALAAATIMAAVGMQPPAQQLPAPQQASAVPHQTPQPLQPQGGAAAMRSAAVAVARAVKVLNGDTSMSAEEIGVTLKQLADNSDFVQMVLLAQSKV